MSSTFNDDAAIRLECLRIANDSSEGLNSDQLIALADQLYAYVTRGSERGVLHMLPAHRHPTDGA